MADMANHASPHQDPIRSSVRVLAAYRDQTQAEVILGTGIPKSTFIRRMHTGGWTVDEVRALARHFGVEPRLILDGPDGMFQAAGVTAAAGYGASTVQYTGENLPVDVLLAA